MRKSNTCETESAPSRRKSVYPPCFQATSGAYDQSLLTTESRQCSHCNFQAFSLTMGYVQSLTSYLTENTALQFVEKLRVS